LDRLKKKHRDSKRAKHNHSFGQNTGIQKTLVETYKENTKKKSTEQKAAEARGDH